MTTPPPTKRGTIRSEGTQRTALRRTGIQMVGMWKGTVTYKVLAAEG